MKFFTDNFASLASVTAVGVLTPTEKRQAAELGLELAPVSLQQQMTGGDSTADPSRLTGLPEDPACR